MLPTIMSFAVIGNVFVRLWGCLQKAGVNKSAVIHLGCKKLKSKTLLLFILEACQSLCTHHDKLKGFALVG
eukprot:4298499-Amphidinium_carterae.1